MPGMYSAGSSSAIVGPAGEYATHSDGYLRQAIVGRDGGSLHQEIAIVELTAGGHVERHVHAFEEGAFLLSGALTIALVDREEALAADDYGSWVGGSRTRCATIRN